MYYAIANTGIGCCDLNIIKSRGFVLNPPRRGGIVNSRCVNISCDVITQQSTKSHSALIFA